MAGAVLVINLTRLGDLLQTQPLLSGLAAAGRQCGLLCLENFVKAAPMLRHVGDVWPLRSSALMAETARDWPAAASRLLSFAASIRGRYAHIINLTPSNPARLLARLVAADGARILGFGMDGEGFGLNTGVWAAFLNVASRRRGSSPFNIADVFRMTALPLLEEPTVPAGAADLARPGRAERAWANEFLGPGNSFVALQPGASASARQWPVGSFASLGASLAEAGFTPVLVGSPAERYLAEAFSAQADFPWLDAVGKTDIPQLAAILERCRLLATNDTGTMHLASGLAVPCLAFFLATAQPWDTGPWSAGSCCLEPAMDCHPCAFNSACAREHACLGQIAPEHAASLALARLARGDWREGLSAKLCASARVWLTGHDSCGFAAITCISGHEAGEKSAWLAWERYFWRRLLDALAGVAAACGENKPAFPPPDDYAQKAMPVLAEGARALDSLKGAAALVGKNPRAGALFLKGCEKIQILLDCCSPLSSLGHFWRELCNDSVDVNRFIGQMDILARHMDGFAADLREAGN